MKLIQSPTPSFGTGWGDRYVGEFAIGVNPFINKAMKDILFDEKIGGSIHFTPGRCYDEAPTATTARSTGTWS